MDQVHVVRHKVLVEGRSTRAVAREMDMSRNTVKKYLEQAAPVRVETGPRARRFWRRCLSGCSSCWKSPRNGPAASSA